MKRPCWKLLPILRHIGVPSLVELEIARGVWPVDLTKSTTSELELLIRAQAPSSGPRAPLL